MLSKTFEYRGRTVSLGYHVLGYESAADARDAAFEYNPTTGAPERIRPFRLITESLCRMLESVDGKPFDRAMLLEWSVEFGDAVATALGLRELLSGDASFRAPDEIVSSGPSEEPRKGRSSDRS